MNYSARAQPSFCSLILLFNDVAAVVAVVVSLIINLLSGFNRKLLSSKLTKRWSVWCFSNCHQKEQLLAFSDSIQTNSDSIMFFPQQLWWEGWLNTVQYTRFSCIYGKCLKDFRLLYAGDRSLYRRAFQNNLSSILHYLLHTLTLLSSISRATGKIFAMWCRHCKLISKIPILPCSLGLWGFCFSFDNAFWKSCILIVNNQEK